MTTTETIKFTEKEWELICHRLEANDAMLESLEENHEYCEFELDSIKEIIKDFLKNGQKQVNWQIKMHTDIIQDAIENSTFLYCAHGQWYDRLMSSQQLAAWRRVHSSALRKITKG